MLRYSIDKEMVTRKSVLRDGEGIGEGIQVKKLKMG
jgi:hypothetical protein